MNNFIFPFLSSQPRLGSTSLSFLSIFLLTLLLNGCSQEVDKSNSSVANVSPPMASKVMSADVMSADIRLNQVGYLPEANKLAVVVNSSADVFKIIKKDSGAEVFTGQLSSAKTWSYSEESTKIADFSAFKEPGEYQLSIEGLGKSYTFAINPDAYYLLNAAAIKAFYLNRASMALSKEHAGIYARAAGHPDTQVLIHPSAATKARPANTVIASAKGWYDAGDYNKYIVNSGISVYTLLAAYEQFPEFFAKQNLNIPESKNNLPDILDEVLWNIEWMLTMQDPNDGGVYHKLTNKKFDDAVMPDKATSPRYVVMKTTAAALDFAATMAAASRVFTAYEKELPGLSAKMKTAAESAWNWAIANPAVLYVQPEDVKTGQYDDQVIADEWGWAAAELYITTQKNSYYVAMKPTELIVTKTTPWWRDVSGLAWMSLAQNRSTLTAAADQALIKERIESFANELMTEWKQSAYKVSMRRHDFVWGSNSVALNQGMMLIQAYRLNGNREYLDTAQSMLDYVLGRNAVSISFVTGFGSRSPMHIHHRPSQADGIVNPLPGFLAGGPQPDQQDKKDCPAYPSNSPALSYLDHDCSYASNEIAINWNAPLVYVSAALQVLTK
jgi:endoglucanase